MYWFNYWGVVIILLMMIPNIIYAKKHKIDFKTGYANKFLELVEQICRYGCIFCMICNFPNWQDYFWFDQGRTVYIFTSAGLCLIYYIFWIVCWKKYGMIRALSLSIIPTIIFLTCGIMMLYIPLIVFAVLFGIVHIYLSYKKEIFKQQ